MCLLGIAYTVRLGVRTTILLVPALAKYLT
jgi:hypothetical protein